MVQSLDDALGEDTAALVQVDTCIVDEAGCVLESSLPVLLRWRPANIVLVGGEGDDHDSEMRSADRAHRPSFPPFPPLELCCPACSWLWSSFFSSHPFNDAPPRKCPALT